MIKMAIRMITSSVINETRGPQKPYKYETTTGPTARDNEPQLVSRPIIVPCGLGPNNFEQIVNDMTLATEQADTSSTKAIMN